MVSIKQRNGLVKILVVDDEEMIRNLFHDILTQTGYRVKTAKDGSEAIKLIEEESFEIVITDLKMPGISGIALLEYILGINPDISVIIITGYGTIESAVNAIKKGAYDYISKPFELEEMKVTIKRAAEKQRLLHDSRMVGFYKNLSIVDGLTGVYNQRYFHEILERELEKAKRSLSVCSLVFLDIDDFKMYNDFNGHLAGDEILRELATIFLDTTRKTDFVTRYGGEEFVIILPDSEIDGALHVCKNIMDKLRGKKWLYVSMLPYKQVTVSIGVASYPADAQLKDELIKKADEAMYHAKKRGKNRIYYYNGGKIVEYKH